ncbi:putative MOB kinase activator family [Helianthus annuus]|nr:putative MOB kinase activator family [Helianthus annuus]
MFRPKKGAPSGSKWKFEGSRSPIPGEDLNEWLAINAVDFFNQVNILYGTLTEFCTPSTCPIMTVGTKYEYRWADGVI